MNAQDWPAYAAIQDPSDLKKWLVSLKTAMHDGQLEQYRPDDAEFATLKSVDEVSAEGPWPDYIEWYFKAVSRSSAYRMTVETYHGAGGVWEKVS